MRNRNAYVTVSVIIAITAAFIAVSSFGISWALGSLGALILILVILLVSGRAGRIEKEKVGAVDPLENDQASDQLDAWRDTRWIGIGMLIAAVGIASALYGIRTVRSLRSDIDSKLSVAITSPREGQQVVREILVEGSSKNLSTEQTIWVAIIPEDKALYYPQNGPANVQADGSWISPSVFLGDQSDVGIKRFEILALVADQRAQQQLAAYLGEEKFPGLVELPQGTIVVDRITVLRK
jgi:hypothetical protein